MTWMLDLRQALRTILSLTLLYALAVPTGLALFALLFASGAFGGVGILFFRGLVLAAISFVALFFGVVAALRAWRASGLGPRDALGAAVLSFSVNVCFLVVVPVTVDRSISVFVLGEMAAEPGRLYSADEMSRLFTETYVGDYQQISRRLHEQSATGNVETVDGRYRITDRGRAFIAFSQRMIGLFGGDPRFASPPRPR